MIDERLCIVIGAPGALSFWMFDVVQALAASCSPIEVRQIERADRIMPSAIEGSQVVLLCHYPGEDVLEALVRSASPVVYVQELPLLVVAHLMQNTGRTLAEAVRVCTASYTGNLALRARAGTIIVERDSEEAVVALLQRVCSHLHLDVESPALSSYAHHVAPNVSLDGAVSRFLPSASQMSLREYASDKGIAAVVHDVLAPIADIALNADHTKPIIWPAELFYSAERPNELAGPFMDLTGPARMLYHGPFLHLPPALYDAEFVVACKDVARNSSFCIEMHAGQSCLARARFLLSNDGGFRGRFVFEHRQSGPEVQMQLIAERGAIEGELALVQLSLRARS